MAKTYINNVKYMIKAKFEINGVVDKHDIIGAVFGQSEGLIGDDLDLRELQKNGKIGRIEINSTTVEGKTAGELFVPSSMDMVKTSILAAAIETVEKVGPWESKFEILTIDDTRSAKRKEIIERSKELLKKLNMTLPQAQELAEEIKEDVWAADIVSYGTDNLSAGPDIDSSNEIILVEGRADVLNLLRNQVRNVIAVEGSTVSPTIIELCSKKSITVFFDGDRGGLLNLRRLQQSAKVDFVAKAPEGKEVEELTRKEIVMALRKKIPISEMNLGPEQPSTGFEERSFDRPMRSDMHGGMRSRGPGRFSPRPQHGPRTGGFGGRPPFEPRQGFGGRPSRFSSRPQRGGGRPGAPRMRMSFSRTTEAPEKREIPANLPPEAAEFSDAMREIKDSLKARLLDSQKNAIAEVPVRDLLKTIKSEKGIDTVIFDGVVTKRLVDEAVKSGVKTIVGVKKGSVPETPEIKIITLS